jgi:hypothetical protein
MKPQPTKVQFEARDWVPDVRSPEFVSEARRQSLAVAKSRYAKRDQAFIEAISG